MPAAFLGQSVSARVCEAVVRGRGHAQGWLEMPQLSPCHAEGQEAESR